MTLKTANELWSDYLFLTCQMNKFIAVQNYEMFTELLQQRERLQKIIEQAQDAAYKQSPEGRQVMADIQRENQFITNQLRIFLNKAKQEETVNQAYDPYMAAKQVGGWMDRQS